MIFHKSIQGLRHKYLKMFSNVVSQRETNWQGMKLLIDQNNFNLRYFSL